MVSSRSVATWLLGGALTAGAWACGSGDTSDMPSYTGGGPAHAEPTHDAGGGSSSGGSGGSGSSSGSESPNHTGDGGTPGFGGVVVASFTLIDAAITSDPAGSPVPGYDPIPYGAIIDLAHVGRSLSLRANPPPVGVIGSVAFALDATYTHTANATPYSLCGDDGKGKFTPCMLSDEPHTLTVTIYPEAELGGTPYQPTTFEFTVVDSALDAGTD